MQSAAKYPRKAAVDDSNADYDIEIPDEPSAELEGYSDTAIPMDEVNPTSTRITLPFTRVISGAPRIETQAISVLNKHCFGVDRLDNSFDIERPDEVEEMDCDSIQQLPHTQEIVIESLEDALEGMTEEVSLRDKLLVVIDAANVGWAHGGGSFFSPRGVLVAIETIQNAGTKGSREVEVMSFLPASYVRRRPQKGSNITGNALMVTEEWEMLDNLVSAGSLTLVPAGDHDDVYLISYAKVHNGYVISNDFFADHIDSIKDESKRRSLKLWIQERRCSYVFTKPDEFMLNPEWLVLLRHNILNELITLMFSVSYHVFCNQI